MSDQQNQMLLMTSIPGLNEKIKSFSHEIKNTPFEILDNTDTEIINESIAILLAKDQIDEVFNKKYSNRASPVIYLYWEEEDHQKISTLAYYVDEIIDMKKVSASVFFSTIHTAVERFYIKHELSIQQNALKKLLGEETINSEMHSEVLSMKQLVEQNKLLIQTIEKQNEQLKKTSRIDPLTKIGNRLAFNETFEQVVADSLHLKQSLALLLIDLDKFKLVNDTLGHDAGDLLLQAVANRLKKVLRNTDFIARMGGDEFAVILYDVKSPHAAGIAAWRILEEFNHPLPIFDTTHYIQASIGISYLPLTGNTVHNIMKNADIAMYRAKKSACKKYIFANAYTESDSAITLQTEIKAAFENKEFSLVYQPIYTIPEKKLHGFEALIRWESKNITKMTPSDFIPIAEQCGLIHPINQWVIENVFRQLHDWKKEGEFGLPISISISLSQLAEKNFATLFQKNCEEYKISPSMIEFQVREMATLVDTALTLNFIENQAKTESQQDTPKPFISTVKIDQSFIQNIYAHEYDEKIIVDAIQFAKEHNLKVLAENVETLEQLNFLIQKKCDFIEGYYLSRPLSAYQALHLVQKEKMNGIDLM